MSTAVRALLDQFRALPPEDREAFEQELRAWHEQEWKRLEDDLRRYVAEKGLTEEDVDRMCHEVRYGDRLPFRPHP